MNNLTTITIKKSTLAKLKKLKHKFEVDSIDEVIIQIIDHKRYCDC